MQPSNVFTIFNGDDKTMNLKAVYAENLDPLDLTSCTAIDVLLPNSDGSTLDLSIISGAVVIASPAVLGKFTAAISSAQSSLLNPGEFQSFDVVFTIASKKTTVSYKNALSVFEQ